MRHLGDRRRALVTATLGLIVSAILLAAAAPPGSQTKRLVFEPLIRADMHMAGMAGMGGLGCGWIAARGRQVRFYMSGAAAVAKSDGVLVRFAPAAGSLDAFPFTYDQWIGGSIAVRIRRHGKPRATGDEETVQAASLEISRAGRPARYEGSLSCGS